MPLILSRNDITRVRADAIVLPANQQLQQGRGTSRAIYLAAGEEELTEACRRIGNCPVGDAVVTPAFALDAKIIVHAVGPVWQGGGAREADLLYSAYRSSLEKAWDAGCGSIAFPLLSAGSYGYPKAGALNVANHAITDFLMDHDMDVQLVFYDSESVAAGRSIYRKIEEYIDDRYIGSRDEDYPPGERRQMTYRRADNIPSSLMHRRASEDEEEALESAAVPDLMIGSALEDAMVSLEDATAPARGKSVGKAKPKGSLKERISSLVKGDSENFHDMLFRLIDESGMSYPQVYSRANMSKKLFSKIKLNPDSTPKKKNILALAIALRLDMDQTEELLMKAGYALSNSSMADVIISYFIEKRIYDVFEINEALFEYGLENELLGF